MSATVLRLESDPAAPVDMTGVLPSNVAGRDEAAIVAIPLQVGNRRVPLGDFESKPPYRGEWRCDTHPRSSRDGKLVCVDSPHGGDGRQMYLIDLREIAGGPWK